MRNCKVIFYKTEKRGKAGRTAVTAAVGGLRKIILRFCRVLFAETQRGARPSGGPPGEGREALTRSGEPGEKSLQNGNLLRRSKRQSRQPKLPGLPCL